MLFNPYKDIEGYAEAVEKQDLVRDVAFLGVPEIICGISVAPMTFRHLLWLQMIESPLIGAGEPDVTTLHLAIAGFFKTLAPLDKPSFMLTQFDLKQRKELKSFMRQVGKLKAPEALKSIREFVSETFMDAPGGGEDKTESYFSIGAALTHRLAKNYPLNANPYIYPGALDVPLKAGFQLLKLIKADDCAEAGKKPVLFNGLSDAAKSRWLESENKGLN